MAIRHDSLDNTTREYMLAALAIDVNNGTLYLSSRLNHNGSIAWLRLLEEAIRSHDDRWLAESLRNQNLLNETEEKRKPKGGTTLATVPITAPDTLAEGEFNRFYARGLCARAIQVGIPEVEVYRGKQVEHARSASEAKIGMHLPAQELLEDLRKSIGVEPAFGLPPGPNSGLSVRLLADNAHGSTRN